LKVNCSFCKNPISSNSKICEWCGNTDPVKILNNVSGVHVEEGSENIIKSNKYLVDFLTSVRNVNSNFKNGSSRGIIGSLIDKIDGNDLESDKITLINGFREEINQSSIQELFVFVLVEYDMFLKSKSIKFSILNPTNSKDLINEKIMKSWSLLINYYSCKIDYNLLDSRIKEVKELL